MKDLEARKKALAAEAEVYRQAVTLEVQNLRLYAKTRKRRMSSLSTANPLLNLLMPVAGVMAVKRGRSWSGLLSGAMLGWKFYRSVMPVVRGLWYSPRPPARTEAEDILSTRI